MRVCVAVVTLVSVWVFGTADAFGIRIRRAPFSASLAGTYTTSAAITESQCGTSGPNGELINTPPVKGTATERVSFSSARRTRLTVEEFDSPPLAGGGRMSIRVRATRASDLSRSGHLHGCLPGFDATDRQTRCGTRSHTFSGDYLTANRGSGLGFAFIRQGRFVAFPHDLFGEDCQLAPGQVWLGQLTPLTAPVSAAKLFNRHRRTIVVVGRRSGRSHDSDGTVSASATYSERLTLTLRRVG